MRVQPVVDIRTRWESIVCKAISCPDIMMVFVTVSL
jgi:hypothetical protein